jgi:diamine N-acetyltransferase
LFEKEFYYFWRLMIDKNHQGKGYGKQAVAKILEEVKTEPYKGGRLCLCFLRPGEHWVKKHICFPGF